MTTISEKLAADKNLLVECQVCETMVFVGKSYFREAAVYFGIIHDKGLLKRMAICRWV